MKRSFLLRTICGVFAGGIALQAVSKEPPGLPEPICLWTSERMPFCQEGAAEDHKTSGMQAWTDVYRPRMYFFPASGKQMKPCVLVCPGGAYKHLSYKEEGVEVCKWLNAQGVNAFLLFYRVNMRMINPDGALADAQQALKLIRNDSSRYGVKKGSVGMMGFSAGANLTARTCCSEVRPSYAFVIYPYWMEDPCNTKGSHPFTVRDVFNVDARCPPTFIVQTEDDPCRVESALTWYVALKYAGVPVEMHLYENGGHGYGISRKHSPARSSAVEGWEELAMKWMQRREVMGLLGERQR